MRVKTIIDEDFVNYKEPSMFIGTISCNGKCCIEAGIPLSVCQNDSWRSCDAINIPDADIVKRYKDNPYTNAIVFGGLEPFEQFTELFNLIREFRNSGVFDTIIIYTGYNRSELEYQINSLKFFGNIIIKFGRFIPNSTPRYDDLLGVTLASSNQYAQYIE